MRGIKKDSGQNGTYLLYKGGVSVNEQVDKLATGEVENFVKNLWKLYKRNDQNGFRRLLSKDARKNIEKLGEDVFTREWDVLRAKKNALLKTYFPYKGGYVVSWQVGGIPRGIFVKKIDGEFKIADLKAGANEAEFHNRSLYFTYLPTKEKKAKIVSDFSLGSESYELVLEIEKERPYAHIFKKEDGKWVAKVTVKDNEVGKVRFDDLDPEQGKIKIAFSREHFTQNTAHELLVLQSNFPMAYFPMELEPEGNLLITK